MVERRLVTNTSTGMGTTATSSTNANTSLTAGKDQSIPQQQLHDENNGQQSARSARSKQKARQQSPRLARSKKKARPRIKISHWLQSASPDWSSDVFSPDD